MWLIIAVLFFTLVGCQSHASEPEAALVPPTDLATAEHSIVSGKQIHFLVSDISVTIQRPPKWEYFETDYGIVLAEHMTSVAGDGQLQGLWAHIHVPPLDDMPTPAAQGSNQAWEVLDQLSKNPDYMGSAKVTEPVGFIWNNLDAAYYLMNNGEGNVTLIIAVVAPQTRKLVACSLTAPDDQAERIRKELPHLLDQLTINGVTLNSVALDTLPDPLAFPQDDP